MFRNIRDVFSTVVREIPNLFNRRTVVFFFFLSIVARLSSWGFSKTTLRFRRDMFFYANVFFAYTDRPGCWGGVDAYRYYLYVSFFPVAAADGADSDVRTI